ncbi:MAG TPA: AIR synthase-related protein [Patescibacteria group bacterium]|jgi:phosphoribosylformylglycinamidine cyclo-ligase|nr:AIR synthase-related protein [Patescibacteria group bacterium]
MNNYFQEIIDPGNRASKLAKEIGFQSHGNNKAIHVIPHQPGNFRGGVGFIPRRHILEQMLQHQTDSNDKITDWNFAFEVENDGAGGKPQFFTMLNSKKAFRNLGWEIITMTADDFARSGRFPVVIDNEVNAKIINNANFPMFRAMMEGYGVALQKARLVNITGETAIMKNSITAFCDDGHSAEFTNQLTLTWGASCIGLAHRESLIDGSKIKPGQAIVGFWEPGYRCNGGTFLTTLFYNRWTPYIDLKKDGAKNIEAREFLKGLTIPSKSYARLVTSLLGWQSDGTKLSAKYNIYGIAHITGGGLWEKFGEILPAGVGAYLATMPKPADVLLKAYAYSQGTAQELTPHEAYRTFHGGCGMLLVCDSSDVNGIITMAKGFGIKASRVGDTIESIRREVIINSRFGSKDRLSSLDLKTSE